MKRLEDLLYDNNPAITDQINQPLDIAIDRDDFIGSDQVLSELDTEMMIGSDDEPKQDVQIPDYLINDPELVGYPDEMMQFQIYNWVKSSILSGSSVKDFGCGRGDFGDHVRGYVDGYIGVDFNPILLNAGKKRYEDLSPFLYLSDWFNIQIGSDHTTIIGSLNSDNGQDKWEYFNKTLQHAINTTDISVIMILNKYTDIDGYVDYPINEVLNYIPDGLPFELDYSVFENIYKLVIYTKSFK